MPKVIQADFQGDHNLGLFAIASDNFCLTGNIVSKEVSNTIEKVLDVSVVNAAISNTDLCGIFAVMNSNGMLLPKIVYDHEVERIKELVKEFDINVQVMDSKYTAVGNLVLCNDKGAILSKLFSVKEIYKIKDCLGIETEVSTVANINTVGSSGIATNKGCLLHRDAQESEINLIKDLLKVDADIGTANFGSPFVGSCMIANSNGCVAGLSTTGHEITRLMEALKFL